MHLVPKSEPTSQEAVVLRIKKAPRPAGVLQCNRCGGRTVLNTQNGVVVQEDGRRRPGTKIKVDVCADCDARGIYSPMQPAPKPAT